MCFHPTFPKTRSLRSRLNYLCIADTHGFIHAPSIYNMFQFVSTLDSLQKNDNSDFQSLILIVCTPWNLKCEFQSCLKCLYVLNLEMTTYGLKTYDSQYQITQNLLTVFVTHLHWRSHHPQRYSCGAAYSTRYQGRRWNGADGLMVSGCLGLPFKGTNAILSELLIINVWYIDQYLFWYSTGRFEFDRLFLQTFYI